jgi:hypothetical protein
MAGLWPPGLVRLLGSESIPASRRPRGTQASMTLKYISPRNNDADDERLHRTADGANVA